MKYYIFVLFVSFTFNANAAFVLNSTRYIYDEDMSSISVDIKNESDDNYGGYISIEKDGIIDEKVNSNSVLVVPSPPVFKVSKNSRQKVKLKIINQDRLPSDRESLFWINVQEIPIYENEIENNSLSLAMNVKVKLIYRPKQLEKNRISAESHVRFVHEDGQVKLVNNTPYIFAITNVSIDGVEIKKLSQDTLNSLSKFMPYSEVTIAKKIFTPPSTIAFTAIDDWGSFIDYEI